MDLYITTIKYLRKERLKEIENITNNCGGEKIDINRNNQTYRCGFILQKEMANFFKKIEHRRLGEPIEIENHNARQRILNNSIMTISGFE